MKVLRLVKRGSDRLTEQEQVVMVNGENVGLGLFDLWKWNLVVHHDFPYTLFSILSTHTHTHTETQLTPIRAQAILTVCSGTK